MEYKQISVWVRRFNGFLVSIHSYGVVSEPAKSV